MILVHWYTIQLHLYMHSCTCTCTNTCTYLYTLIHLFIWQYTYCHTCTYIHTSYMPHYAYFSHDCWCTALALNLSLGIFAYGFLLYTQFHILYCSSYSPNVPTCTQSCLTPQNTAILLGLTTHPPPQGYVVLAITNRSLEIPLIFWHPPQVFSMYHQA